MFLILHVFLIFACSLSPHYRTSGWFPARLVDQTGTSFFSSLLYSSPGVSLVFPFQSEMANINPQITSQHALSRRAVSPVLYFSDSGQTTSVLLHFQMVDPDVFRLQVLHTTPLGNGEFQNSLSTLA